MRRLPQTVAAVFWLWCGPAAGDAGDGERPAIQFNRWQENWSVLADPAVPREPLDGLKYLSLSDSDPLTYASFGANLRERFESNDAAGFGTSGSKADQYVISRLELHSDLHVGPHLQMFTQLQSDHAIDKSTHSPVDQDRLDLEQAFIAVVTAVDGGTVKLRVGRQQFAFDLQRFVSVRDGPNVRQSYDAAWADYESGAWRLISFYSHPVQARDTRPFDDTSNGHLTYGGLRLERQLTSSSSLAAYVSRFTQDSVRFTSVTGNEQRQIADLHYAGTLSAVDWDIEAMGQSGRVGSQDVRAWALGSLAGYTFTAERWRPRVGVQFDVASGDKHPDDGQLNTFNPLFPNGYYLTLSGYTGYVNLVHLKPSVTLYPASGLKVLLAAGAQWRQTTADAVYTQPNIPIAHTAGLAGRYTGTYGQFRADCALTAHVAVALEVVHFAVSRALRTVGAHDSDYLGAEVKLAW